MAKWDLNRIWLDQGKVVSNENIDSAQSFRDIKGVKYNYMEHKKLENIYAGVYARRDA
jgi:hypothetical protein